MVNKSVTTLTESGIIITSKFCYFEFMLKVVLFFSSIIGVLSSFSQGVEERIKLDTINETINVIYKSDIQTTYYYKKVAVFADDTSQVAIEKSFNKFGQNGLYKVYYPSGRLKIKTVFANNKINGEWTYYGTDGIIITKGIYKDGVKHGYWAYKSLRIYGRYKKGYKNKKWKRFDKNEKKYLSHYKNGILTGGEGYDGDEKVDGVPVRRNIFARIFSKKAERPENVEEKDTIRGEPIQEYQGVIISKEYQQAISFLSTNALFRRNAKSHFGGSIKKYFKKDKFQFVINPTIKNLSIDYFLKESEAGNIVVANIDSTLKNNVEILQQTFANKEVFKEDALSSNSTDPASPIKVILSEVKYNLLRVDIIWSNENKKYQLLLYYDNDGILKGAEYEKD